MSEVEFKKAPDSLQDRLAQVVDLLHRHKLVEDLAHRQEGHQHARVESLVHRQNLAELQEAYPKLMIPLTIGLRSSIADALADQMPVWQIKKTSARKAAQEIRALAAYAIDKMENK